MQCLATQVAGAMRSRAVGPLQRAPPLWLCPLLGLLVATWALSWRCAWVLPICCAFELALVHTRARAAPRLRCASSRSALSQSCSPSTLDLAGTGGGRRGIARPLTVKPVLRYPHHATVVDRLKVEPIAERGLSISTPGASNRGMPVLHGVPMVFAPIQEHCICGSTFSTLPRSSSANTHFTYRRHIVSACRPSTACLLHKVLRASLSDYGVCVQHAPRWLAGLALLIALISGRCSAT